MPISQSDLIQPSTLEEKNIFNIALLQDPETAPERKKAIIEHYFAERLSANMEKLEVSRAKKHLVYWKDLLKAGEQIDFKEIHTWLSNYTSHPDFEGHLPRKSHTAEEAYSQQKSYILKDGKKPSLAIESLLTVGSTTIDCIVATYIVYFLTLLDLLRLSCGKKIGEERFDALFSTEKLFFGPQDFYLSYDPLALHKRHASPLNFFLQEAAREKNAIVSATGESLNPEIGGRVQFLNCSEYGARHPLGSGNAFNVIAVGKSKARKGHKGHKSRKEGETLYRGFGFPGSKTALEIRDFLLQSCDEPSIEEKHPENYISFALLRGLLKKDRSDRQSIQLPGEIQQNIIFKKFDLDRLSLLLGNESDYESFKKSFDSFKKLTTSYQGKLDALLVKVDHPLLKRAPYTWSKLEKETAKNIYEELLRELPPLAKFLKKNQHYYLCLMLAALLAQFYKNICCFEGTEDEHVSKVLENYLSGYKIVTELLENSQDPKAIRAVQKITEGLYEDMNTIQRHTILTPELAERLYQQMLNTFTEIPSDLEKTRDLLDRQRQPEETLALAHEQRQFSPAP